MSDGFGGPRRAWMPRRCARRTHVSGVQPLSPLDLVLSDLFVPASTEMDASTACILLPIIFVVLFGI
jgi:hypothetical protein